jgi:two-component system, LuxR family, response regulator FixJ
MLSQREQQVLDEVVRGRTTKEIASRLQLSPRTIDVHRGNILHKMGDRNAIKLVRKVIGREEAAEQ